MASQEMEAGGCTQAAQRVAGETLPPAPPEGGPAEGPAEVCRGPRRGLPEPCPHCGCPPPQTAAPRPSGRLTAADLRGSSQSVSSGRSQSRDGPPRSTTPDTTDDASCLGLLLACLSCQGWAVLLGLLAACASCLGGLCSCCCCGGGCARCCAEALDAPVREFGCCHARCHAVAFESCCESTECLEFCLDCCLICHQS